MGTGNATLAVRNLRKSYGPVEAVRGVSLDVNAGEVVVIIGPSGCGKSTTLRC
ncbi:MAG: ATP-binding cassette domain-containing protein, partial [Hyphomicrobiaceae bacterium]